MIHLNAPVRAVEIGDNGLHKVRYGEDGQIASLQASYVWSTLPIAALARSLRPDPPPTCLHAAESLGYRGMVLIYLVLARDRFSEFDAHYFPGADVPVSRLSEPKNYSGTQRPPGQTVLCAELPCAPGGLEWHQSDDELGQLVRHSLEVAEIPVRGEVRRVVTRRIKHAYPIYRQGYEAYFDRLDRWIGQADGLLTFGRQGLFAHDNTHHALYTGYAAAKCLDGNGGFDREKWRAYRQIFENHVVED
jgi:protoporphyrinogen oxidase